MERHVNSKLALVGMGRWGQNLAREFDKLGNLQVGVTKSRGENYQRFCARYPSVLLSTNKDEVLNMAEVDAVVIATPIDEHAEIVQQALESGKDVFVEKPLTTNPEESRRLQLLAEHQDKILFVGYINLYSPAYETTADLLKGRQVSTVKSEWTKWGTFDSDIFWNLVVHDISIAYSLFGKPESMRVVDKKGVETECDIVQIELKYFSGLTYEILINRAVREAEKDPTKKMKLVSLETRDGTIVVWRNNDVYLNGEKQEVQKDAKNPTTPLRAECEAFLLCIKERTTPLTDANFAIEVETITRQLKNAGEA